MTDKANNAPAAQDENKLIAERRVKLEKIRTNCSANGFPNDFNREHLAADIQAEHGEKNQRRA
jgi:lysyl-tRNA synthetase class 2